MIYVRRTGERRHIKSATQDTFLTFDPENKADHFHRGFRGLEALNEEVPLPTMSFQPNKGEPVEVLTYVRDGAVLSWDSAGKQEQVRAGEFHRTSPRSKIRRHFINESLIGRSQAFQIWFRPEGGESRSRPEQAQFTNAERRGVLRPVASSDGKSGSLRIHQDMQVYSSILLTGQHVVHEIGRGRGAWLHVVEGRVALRDLVLDTGDGAGLEDEVAVSITAQAPSEVLLINLA